MMDMEEIKSIMTLDTNNQVFNNYPHFYRNLNIVGGMKTYDEYDYNKDKKSKFDSSNDVKQKKDNSVTSNVFI